MGEAGTPEVNVNMDPNGAWNYMWKWYYSGDQSINAHEEIEIWLADGSWSDRDQTDDHIVGPGETSMAGQKYPGSVIAKGGNVQWTFKVVRTAPDPGAIGATAGSFDAMLPIDS